MLRLAFKSGPSKRSATLEAQALHVLRYLQQVLPTLDVMVRLEFRHKSAHVVMRVQSNVYIS